VAAFARVREWARDVYRRIERARVFDSAASSAFWLFFALLPLVVVSVMILTKVAAANASLLASLLDSVPAPSRSFVEGQLRSVAAWNGGTVGPISVVVFVWLASSGVHAILDSFDATVDADRPWWKKRVISIAICFGLSIVIGIGGFAFGLLGRHLAHALTQSPARYVLAIACEVALITALFGAGMPRGAHMPARRWPGAVLAAALQSLLGWGYVAYFRWLGHRSAYATATLAAIGATMIATYLFTLSLLVGVSFNAAVGGRRDPKRERRLLRSRQGSGGREAREKTEPATH